MITLDSHDRPLTSAERVEHDRLLPALQVWTGYLDDVAAVRTFDRATERQAPIVLRHRPSTKLGPGALYAPLAVFPQWALGWAQRKGRLGAAGTGSVLTFGQLVSALDFMGASRAVTFRPIGDATGCRRREGFFHLQREVVARLRGGGNYVPVLTRRPGRPLSRDRVAGGRTTRALRRADGDYTLTVVRDWIRVNPITALHSVATARGYPLATRPAGRPRMAAVAGAQVSTDYVIGHVDALTDHAILHADRLGIRVPSRGELLSALAGHAADGPVVAPVDRFSTPDGGQRRPRHAGGWWRFALAPLGLPSIEPGDLLAEVQHWERTRDQEKAAPARRGSFTLPPGVKPEDLEDPEFREIYMTDDEYARWKEGL